MEMDDIDDLFTEQLNDGLNDQLNGELQDELETHLETQLADPLAAQLDIPTNVPPPAGLVERLDELHAGGCNQSIAWSRLGSLACIGSDKRTISIKCLQFRHSGNWELSDYTDPSLMEKLSGFYRGYDFVHVAWGPTGTELIVIDSCGRIAVGYIYIALNRIMVHKMLNYDPEDNLNAVVAIKWLNQIRKPLLIAGVATKEDGRWKYPLTQTEPRGPFSPNTKSGFLIVTRGSMLKLYLQNAQSGDWMETKYELDGLSSSHEIISHAAMCTERNTLKKDDEILLAVHTTAKRLRLYTVRIDWQMSQDPASVTASFQVQHLTQLDRCLPLPDQDMMSVAANMAQDEAELCSLTLMSRPSPQPDPTYPALPILLATFSQTGLAGSVHTVVSRWEVDETSASVDPAFHQLSTKKSSQGRLSDERILRSLEDVRFDRLIINVELTYHDSMLALCFSTGEVDFRDRHMNALSLEVNSTRASSLSSIGFCFDRSQPCLQTTLAAHGTIKVSMNKAHECKLASMHLLLPVVDLDLVSQVTASFVLQHAASEGIGSSPTDDLVMTMWEFERQLTEDQRRSMEAHFMKDLYQTLQVTDKCADSNLDGLIKFTALGRTASIQSALGVRTVGNQKLRWTRPGKIAFTLQSLRNIALSLSLSVVSLPKNQNQEVDLHRPETLDYVTPQVKWFITLVDYILDQLFQVNRVAGTESFDGDFVSASVESAYACLVLVMCTITRNYLRYIIRAIKALPQILHSGMSQTASPLSKKYTALSAALRSCVISPSQFDQILEATDHILNQFYPKMRPGQRQEIEMQLLAEATIPSILFPIIHKLLSAPIEAARIRSGELEEVLAFRQWGPVSLVDDRQTLKWDSETLWDGSRKVELTGKNIKTRTCLRCTGHMEEPPPGKERTQRVWLSNLTRTCFCGGHWIINRSPEVSA